MHEANETNGKQRRGFGAMDPEKVRAIASAGGKAAHAQGAAHEFTSEEARGAGRRGGEKVSQNRDHMRAIGQKGGGKVSADRAHMAAIGSKGGTAVSVDREHMAEIGRRGGEAKGAASSLGTRGGSRPSSSEVEVG